MKRRKSEDWKKAIQEKYIFLHHPESTVLNKRGIECESGWRFILEELFKKIEKVLTDESITDFCLVQVKEKFGRLRIYASKNNTVIDKIISEYAEKSCKVCELCGMPGTIKNLKGRSITVCPACIL